MALLETIPGPVAALIAFEVGKSSPSPCSLGLICRCSTRTASLFSSEEVRAAFWKGHAYYLNLSVSSESDKPITKGARLSNAVQWAVERGLECSVDWESLFRRMFLNCEGRSLAFSGFDGLDIAQVPLFGGQAELVGRIARDELTKRLLLPLVLGDSTRHPQRVLLLGPPGSGKTVVAASLSLALRPCTEIFRCYAHELRVEPELISDFLATVDASSDDQFAASVLVLIEEVESLLPQPSEFWASFQSIFGDAAALDRQRRGKPAVSCLLVMNRGRDSDSFYLARAVDRVAWTDSLSQSDCKIILTKELSRAGVLSPDVEIDNLATELLKPTAGGFVATQADLVGFARECTMVTLAPFMRPNKERTRFVRREYGGWEEVQDGEEVGADQDVLTLPAFEKQLTDGNCLLGINSSHVRQVFARSSHHSVEVGAFDDCRVYAEATNAEIDRLRSSSNS